MSQKRITLEVRLPPRSAFATETAVLMALEALADVFDRKCFSTVLLTGEGRVPRLTVAGRHARLAFDVFADQGWYWSSAPAKIAPMTDPAAAAAVVEGVIWGRSASR